MPQSEKSPLGLAQGQPLRTCLKQGKIGPFPLHQHPLKTEVPPQTAAIPHAMVMPKQVIEKCSWGLYCPICKNEEEHGEEDWNSNRQAEQLRNHCPQNTQHPQLQNTQHPQSFDVPDRYSEQIRLRREWEEKMEHLNEKYNLDYYSSSESDSDFEPEHKYETLI